MDLKLFSYKRRADTRDSNLVNGITRLMITQVRSPTSLPSKLKFVFFFFWLGGGGCGGGETATTKERGHIGEF